MVRDLFLWCVTAIAINFQQPARTESDSGRWLAVHRQEERQWAKKEKLSVSAIRSILSAAGLKRDGDFYIENLDAHTLASRKHVLLSTWESGTGKCLAAHILQRNKGRFREVWSAAGVGEENFCSPGVCGGAKAYATLHHVMIEIPLNCHDLFDRDEPGGEVDVRCARFSWKGNTYELTESKAVSIPVVRYKKEIRHCAR